MRTDMWSQNRREKRQKKENDNVLLYCESNKNRYLATHDSSFCIRKDRSTMLKGGMGHPPVLRSVYTPFDRDGKNQVVNQMVKILCDHKFCIRNKYKA